MAQPVAKRTRRGGRLALRCERLEDRSVLSTMFVVDPLPPEFVDGGFGDDGALVDLGDPVLADGEVTEIAISPNEEWDGGTEEWVEDGTWSDEEWVGDDGEIVDWTDDDSWSDGEWVDDGSWYEDGEWYYPPGDWFCGTTDELYYMTGAEAPIGSQGGFDGPLAGEFAERGDVYPDELIFTSTAGIPVDPVSYTTEATHFALAPESGTVKFTNPALDFATVAPAVPEPDSDDTAIAPNTDHAPATLNVATPAAESPDEPTHPESLELDVEHSLS